MIRPTAAKPIWRALLALLVLGGILLALSSGPAEAAVTFTVNQTTDIPDRKLSDTVCDTSRKRGKQCTLRAAIQESNDTLGADTINFKIGGTTPVKTINVGNSGLGALPDITDPVTINGYSQPGSSPNTLATGNNTVLKIQLNGTNAGSSANGLTISDAADSTIKGLAINRFSGSGISIEGTTATRNKVEGNFIGTDASGAADLGNTNNGVFIEQAPDNTIGGTASGARNIISGNNQSGINLFGSGATDNGVKGNFIGTKANGTEALANTANGVLITSSASNNTIGGTVSGAGNVISGNESQGVLISSPGATDNAVKGNFIGTDASGAADLGNTNNGVFIEQAPDNTIGGTVSGARNIISGNNQHGVHLFGSGATDNEVKGNFIGTKANGTEALANTANGVLITFSASNNTIGRTVSGAGNVISGNGNDGVQTNTGATGNEILGNFIGTDASGTADLGNSSRGVSIFNGSNNTIGGTASGARNVISGNTAFGVLISGGGATLNKVEGNFIGTTADGDGDLGNNEEGVIISGASNNTIGGTASGAGNRIAHNAEDGVSVSGSSTGNSVLSNSIFSNTGLGIDLDTSGVTNNDDDDPDTGANNLQNFPVITSAVRDSTTGTTTITGTLNSNPSQNYTIQCFKADGATTDHGEGETLLDTTTTTTDANGDSPNPGFTCTSNALAANDVVTATATNTSGTATNTAIGDTSEFSQNFGVVAGP